MCGIAGIIGPGACSSESRAALAAMTATLAPRGPDEEAFWHAPEGDAALGFRRLAILDVPGGHQPASNEDGSVRLVFNGEIYNFPELHHRLEALGHRLTGRGDTATLPHLYEEDGSGLFTRLRGMFAIAIWDAPRHKLVLGRDRFGQKPLVYRITSTGQLHFASELKALRAAEPGWQPELDLVALDHYLAFGYVPAPLTIYKNVRKLPAGHFATFENGRILVESYWKLDWSKQLQRSEITFDQAAVEFRELLENAIAEQNVADVPVGVFLSGGVDSSIIAALSSRLTQQPIRSFSVSFDDIAFDESSQAEAFARKLGADHTTIHVGFNARDTLQELVLAYDEPLADNSALPTWLLARETAKHVKVVLSGDGGDELALGYDRYRAIALSDRLKCNLPAPLLKFLSGPLARRIPSSSRAKTRGRRIRSFLESLGHSEFQLVSKWLFCWDESLRLHLYKPETLDRLIAAYDSADHAEGPATLVQNATRLASGRSLVRSSQAADVAPTGYLPGDLMFKVDIASMAHSLECRSPFLDHRLAEFAASLPDNYLLDSRTGKGKQIFARACADVVPKEIFQRRKMGFAAPVDRWLRGPLSDDLKTTLLGNDSRIQSILAADSIKKIIFEHLSGQADHAYRLWSLLVLESWLRRYAPRIASG